MKGNEGRSDTPKSKLKKRSDLVSGPGRRLASLTSSNSLSSLHSSQSELLRSEDPSSEVVRGYLGLTMGTVVKS